MRRISLFRRLGGAGLVGLSGCLVLITVLALASFGLTPTARLTPLVFDAYQRILPREEAGAPIVIVDIDEASIARIGQWPWSRAVIARMVDRLGELGAASIAFDVVFPDPDRTSLSAMADELRNAGASVALPAEAWRLDPDATLAVAFAQNSVTVGMAITDEVETLLPVPKAGFSFGGSDPSTYLREYRGGVSNLAALNDAADGLGFFSFPPSRDGIVRTLPLIARAQDQLYPALVLEALRIAQGAGSYIIRSTDASGEVASGAAAMSALRVGQFEVPTGPAGEFWIYFSGLPSVNAIPAADILENADDAAIAEMVAGRIILVGTSAVGLRDLVATPVDSSMPGVKVHAEILDQIIGSSFLTRPDWAWGAEFSVSLLFGLVLIAIGSTAGAITSSAFTIGVMSAALAISWFGFSQSRLLIDPLLPASTALAVFLGTMPLRLLQTEREKLFVRNAFGRYLSPSLVARLAENPAALRLGGELRDLTVMFSDIRGFTALSEALDPKELTDLLNGFLTPMTDVLLDANATIDKYMGDAIMAFWNAPLDVTDHSRRACLASLVMLDALAELNRTNGKKLEIGIGLNSGPACVGNLGSAQRFSYSAIGDNVNLAARLEGLTKAYGVSILVTEATRMAASDLAFLEVDRVRVVGRHEPVTVFTLLGNIDVAESEWFAQLSAEHAEMIAAYRAAKPDAAEESRRRAAALAPGKLLGLYELYRSRIGRIRAEPPPPNWDGVFSSSEK